MSSIQPGVGVARSGRLSIGSKRRHNPRARRLLFVLRPSRIRPLSSPDKCFRLYLSLSLARGGRSSWFWDWWLWRDFWRYGVDHASDSR